METLRREFHLSDTKSPSPEMFSFPGTPTDNEGDNNSEFEFGSCVTPSSPVTPDDVAKNSASPADQFFLNGRLLPHDFPTVPSSSRASFSGTATPAVSGGGTGAVVNLSRGTSIGSNMSIMSSRSNSSNSRGSSTCSTCSNAKTEVSERKTFHQKSRMVHMKGYCRTASVRDQRNVSGSSSRLGKYYNNGSTSSMSTSSGSSKRWQFITPAPVLGPSLSRSVGSNTSPRKTSGSSNNGSNYSTSNGNSNNNNSNNNNSGGFLYKVLRSFVATCKACHAMEGKDNEFDLNEGSVVR